MEDLLASELRAFGASQVRETRAGVAFSGTLDIAYRCCLWSRIASRVLLCITEFDAKDPDALYEGGLRIPWQDHMAVTSSFAIDCSAKGERFCNSDYAALKLKDALCDSFRRISGARPDVDTENPSIRINLRIEGERAIVSVDLSGESLHRRAYRKTATLATLKENVAAAVLSRAGWEEIAKAGGFFFDPMCGSGTLPIEAALMAGDVAPGLSRARFGFIGWKGHSHDAWNALLDEARERREAGRSAIPRIEGWDRDESAVRASEANAAAAGLGNAVRFFKKDAGNAETEQSPYGGLVATDPPYGKRLEADGDLTRFYEDLGRACRKTFPGMRLAILAGSEELARSVGLRAFRTNTLYNGRIQCTLACFELGETNRFVSPTEKRASDNAAGREMLANRLRKNLKHLGRWARRTGVSCYRLYDRDMPEYAFSVDFFEGKWAHVQEYAAPKEIDPKKAHDRMLDAVEIVSDVLGIGKREVFVKTKRRQKNLVQYERLAAGNILRNVREADCTFLVNFEDYLNVGIFLDHRLTRATIRELAAGKRFLNLFGYTGTASVYAARGGALSTVTVDTSASYLDWAERNFGLNGLEPRKNRLVREDAFAFLERDTAEYGLVFCDVPTFSNTKKEERMFSVEEDHVRLVKLAAARLARGGAILFSTNYRKFKLDCEALSDFAIKDYTARTIPEDFRRDPKVHQCFLISKKETT